MLTSRLGKALFADRSPIPEASAKVHKITSAAEFDALLSATRHVVVDFYADWCPPCRAIAPVFSKLADDHSSGGRLAFAKVNVDLLGDVAGRYGITAMPTFMFFRDGTPFTAGGKVDRIRGADRAALKATVQALAGEGEGEGNSVKKE
jgi:thioredoxin 1